MTVDTLLERVAAGDRLSPDEVRGLAAAPDILALGMLADALRRRLHGTRLTYLRVAVCPFDGLAAAIVPETAREIRLTGVPASVAMAVEAVRSARALRAESTVAGFSWRDIERLAEDGREQIPGVLAQLRDAGLDAIAELPLDSMTDAPAVIAYVMQAGFEQLRLTIDSHQDGKAGGGGGGRSDHWLLAGELQDRFGCIQVLNPLPTIVRPFRPTTGYEDVRTVALARLAAPNIPAIQVDWSRYGPKLAQVALTFGADDVWGVSASDESPEGRRRAPLEEIRRNAEAAGFEPVERDGRFAVPS